MEPICEVPPYHAILSFASWSQTRWALCLLMQSAVSEEVKGCISGLRSWAPLNLASWICKELPMRTSGQIVARSPRWWFPNPVLIGDVASHWYCSVGHLRNLLFKNIARWDGCARSMNLQRDQTVVSSVCKVVSERSENNQRNQHEGAINYGRGSPASSSLWQRNHSIPDWIKFLETFRLNPNWRWCNQLPVHLRDWEQMPKLWTNLSRLWVHRSSM